MGALIIVAQTAITLAILCNSIFIIQQRLDLSDRPSGTQEADIFTIANQWVGQPTDLSSRAQADLAALRSVPGVIDAYISNSYPLSNGGSDDGVSLESTDTHWLTQSALYFADEHGVNTLGLKLIAGRNFEVSEIAGTMVAVAVVLLLGQIAVLWPARCAASISPVAAIRDN